MYKLVKQLATILTLMLIFSNQMLNAETWYEFKSDNFIIYSDAKDEQIQQLANDLEYFRYFLQSLTAVKNTRSALPLIVFAYKNTRKFHNKLGVEDDVGGFYMHNFHGTFAYGDFSKTFLGGMTGREIMFHEYVHFFIRHFSDIQYPRWYDEGFADFLGTFKFDKGIVNIGNVVYNRVYDLKINNDWIPIEKVILRNDWGEVAKKEKQTESLLYSQAWFLVHYLSSDPERKEKLLRYLDAIDKGQPRDQAFFNIFQMDFETLDSKLMAYWENGQIPYTMYDFSNIGFKPDFTTRELSKIEGDLVKMNAQSHRVPFAIKLSKFEKAANKIIKKFPENSTIKNMLAEKLLFYGEDDSKQTGEDLLKTVLAVEPDNSQANALIGLFILDKISDDNTGDENREFTKLGRKYLEKSIAANPNNVFAYYYLGWSYVFVGSDQPQPGINALKTALNFMPQHISIVFHYALINARYGRLDEAIHYFNSSRKFGLRKKWDKAAEFCLKEINENGADHNCIFANLEQFNED